MCGPWLGKHGVNVQKGALFQLDLFFNPDRFSRKNSTFRLPLSFLKTKFQPCFPLQFQPIQIQFKSPPLFLILSFFTGVSPPHALSLNSKPAPCSGFFLFFPHTWNRQANYSLCGSQGESMRSRSCQPHTQWFMNNGQHGAGGQVADYTAVTWRGMMQERHAKHFSLLHKEMEEGLLSELL